MAAEPAGTTQGGFVGRTWRRLLRPSAHWSLLSLLVIGVAIGFVATVGTQVMVKVTGSNAFCGGACHSMQWVAQEHRVSVHGVNRTGVVASCHDCHIPHDYPELLWYKAMAGTKDVIQEMRGVIATEEAFKKERLNMARSVWAEFKANNSRNCRTCHQFNKAVVAKQKDFVQPMHQQVLEGNATCIDCHKGVAHTAPSE
ncbi:MAG TPA: NapC/NirT family cytochrome c [Burkholderiales bacterium]|nr:NapC/NirT family cytochrome c [Burkholderiales bacterium]